ncbi:MAG: hypothetical protein IBX71_10870 [Candidatus Desulforudis sp.]|nr:hypothetical protein [Desulforudis sp.]
MMANPYARIPFCPKCGYPYRRRRPSCRCPEAWADWREREREERERKKLAKQRENVVEYG